MRIQAALAEGQEPVKAYGDGFRAALLSNANLGGDCVNRGLLLGGILGILIGGAHIPQALIDGLYRREQMLPVIHDFAALVCAHHQREQQAPRIVPRFGRPHPLPLADFTGSTAIKAPVDLPDKLALIQAQAAAVRLPVCQLRYVKGVGAVALLHPDHPLAAAAAGDLLHVSRSFVAVPLVKPDPSSPIAVHLDDGDASRDRAEVLAALAGTAAPVTVTGAVAGAGRARCVLTLADASVLHDTLDSAIYMRIDSAEIERAPSAARYPRLELAEGTGMYWYPGAGGGAGAASPTASIGSSVAASSGSESRGAATP